MAINKTMKLEWNKMKSFKQYITETPIIHPHSVDYMRNTPMPTRPPLYHPTSKQPIDLQYNDDVTDWLQGWFDALNEDQKEMILWMIPKLFALQNVAP
jgi:hypothetical protein